MYDIYDEMLRLELWLNNLSRTAPIRYHTIPIVVKDGQVINILVYDNKNNSIEINLCKGGCPNGHIMVGFVHFGDEAITACMGFVGDSVLNNPSEIVDIDDYGSLKIPMFIADKCMYIMSPSTTPQQQHRIPAPARPTT